MTNPNIVEKNRGEGGGTSIQFLLPPTRHQLFRYVREICLEVECLNMRPFCEIRGSYSERTLFHFVEVDPEHSKVSTERVVRLCRGDLVDSEIRVTVTEVSGMHLKSPRPVRSFDDIEWPVGRPAS